MMKIILFILVIVGECLSVEGDHKWEEDRFTAQQHEIVKRKKIEIWEKTQGFIKTTLRSLRLIKARAKESNEFSLKNLTKMVNMETSLTESQIRKILSIQQVDVHERIVLTISEIDKHKRFNESFLTKLGKCVMNFPGFLLRPENLSLLENLNIRELTEKIWVARIHNEWGNLAKHYHKRNNNVDAKKGKNPLRFLSPLKYYEDPSLGNKEKEADSTADPKLQGQSSAVKGKGVSGSVGGSKSQAQSSAEEGKEASSSVGGSKSQGQCSAGKGKEAASVAGSKSQSQFLAQKEKEAGSSSQSQSSAKKEKEAGSKTRESSVTIIQDFINKRYDRDLVTKFIEVCPCTQERLVECTGISRGTISKLKSPQTYGPLRPSAQDFWRWLQSHTVDELKKELGLSNQDVERMGQNLSRFPSTASLIQYPSTSEGDSKSQAQSSAPKEKKSPDFVAEPKSQGQSSARKEKEAGSKTRESSVTIIQDFINKRYDRDLVTKFIKACPCTQERLVECTGISRGTISKLKSPQTYGPLRPSAQDFWRWVQSHTVDGLKKELGLSNQDVERMAQNLSGK